MPMTSRMTWNGGKVRLRERKGAHAGVVKAMEHILGEARKLVPLEYGTLSASGRASTDGELTGAVSFDTVYAVRQHEEITWRHYRPGRQAKYLETPMTTEVENVRRLVQTAIRRALA